MRAANRLLDLDELESPSFQTVLQELDDLVAREDVSYLHPGKRWEYPWALEQAKLRDPARVLDAGCGDSIFPIYLARRGHRVTAVDVRFTANLSELHGVAVDYLRADLRALPIREDAFETIFCISVIEHLPTEFIPGAMQELRRALRPGGELVLTTDYYEDAEAEIWYTGSDLDPFPVDWGFFDENRLRKLILEAPGFRLKGELDLQVDWDTVRREMNAYHGYPYTSVGLVLVRE